MAKRHQSQRATWILLLGAALGGQGCGATTHDSAEATGGAQQETGGRAGSATGGASSTAGRADSTGGMSTSSGGTAGMPATGASSSAGLGGEFSLVETAPQCTGTRSGLTPPPTLLQFVVDTGGPPESAETEARWATISQALREAFASLPPRTAAGVYYYPGLGQPDMVEGPRCAGSDANVPLGVHGGELLESIAKITPGGERPTLDAYSDALERELSANTSSGARVLVLVSGGLPTLGPGCVALEPDATAEASQALLARIEAARKGGVRTLVVGASEPATDDSSALLAPLLSTAAVLGGTALEGCSAEGPDFCHVELSALGGETLSDAVARVAPSVDVCARPLPMSPNGRPFAFKLVFSPSSSQDEFYIATSARSDASCERGYWLDGSTIRLCKDTCAKVRSDPFASLSVEIACSLL